MSKFNERLTLVTNLSVVVGIVFLAIELQQNTRAVQAQTRDSITDKQIEYYGWLANSPQLAEVESIALGAGGLDSLDRTQQRMWFGYVNAIFREWENSFYQYEQGLFSPEEFEARREVFDLVRQPSFAALWARRRHLFSPSFRAEIDRVFAQQ